MKFITLLIVMILMTFSHSLDSKNIDLSVATSLYFQNDIKIDFLKRVIDDHIICGVTRIQCNKPVQLEYTYMTNPIANNKTWIPIELNADNGTSDLFFVQATKDDNLFIYLRVTLEENTKIIERIPYFDYMIRQERCRFAYFLDNLERNKQEAYDLYQTITLDKNGDSITLQKNMSTKLQLGLSVIDSGESTLSSNMANLIKEDDYSIEQHQYMILNKSFDLIGEKRIKEATAMAMGGLIQYTELYKNFDGYLGAKISLVMNRLNRYIYNSNIDDELVLMINAYSGLDFYLQQVNKRKDRYANITYIGNFNNIQVRSHIQDLVEKPSTEVVTTLYTFGLYEKDPGETVTLSMNEFSFHDYFRILDLKTKEIMTVSFCSMGKYTCVFSPLSTKYEANKPLPIPDKVNGVDTFQYALIGYDIKPVEDWRGLEVFLWILLSVFCILPFVISLVFASVGLLLSISATLYAKIARNDYKKRLSDEYNYDSALSEIQHSSDTLPPPVQQEQFNVYHQPTTSNKKY